MTTKTARLIDAEVSRRGITALACFAALATVLSAHPGNKPQPGTRTAFELLASDPSKRAAGKMRPIAQAGRFSR